MCIVAALAIFTSPVDAERATVQTGIQVQVQVPGCFVNALVTLKGPAILNCEDIRQDRGGGPLANAEVRLNYLQAFWNDTGGRVYGTTTERVTGPRFLNGLSTVTFPGSFSVDGGRGVSFKIKYTAHLTFQLTPGGRIVLQSVSYDNFEAVC